MHNKGQVIWHEEEHLLATTWPIKDANWLRNFAALIGNVSSKDKFPVDVWRIKIIYNLK